MTVREVRKVRGNGCKDDSGWTPLQPKFKEQDSRIVHKLDAFDEATGSDFQMLMGHRPHRMNAEFSPPPMPRAYKIMCQVVGIIVMVLVGVALALQYFDIWRP